MFYSMRYVDLVAGRSDGVAVRTACVPVCGSNSRLAVPGEAGLGGDQAASHPPCSLRARPAAVDRQLRSPRRLRIRLPAVVCDVAVHPVPQPPRQDRQRVCVHVCVSRSVCRADRPVLRESAVRVSELPVFQLYSVCAGVLPQDGGRDISFAHLLMLVAVVFITAVACTDGFLVNTFA